MIVTNQKTEIGPKARVTYHATVLSGVKVGEHGMVGSMGVASKDVEPFHIVGGIPAKTDQSEIDCTGRVAAEGAGETVTSRRCLCTVQSDSLPHVSIKSSPA